MKVYIKINEVETKYGSGIVSRIIKAKLKECGEYKLIFKGIKTHLILKG